MKKHQILILVALFVFILSGNTLAIQAEIPSDTQAVAAKSPAQVALSGEIRVRLEDVSTGTAGIQSQEKILQRTRLNVAAGVVKNTKAFVSIQDSRAWGEEATTITTGNETQSLDLSQGYFQLDNIGAQPLSLRVGRQFLIYGDSRLIGSGEWSSGRRFDAVKIMYDSKTLSIDLWDAKVLEPASTTATPAVPGDKDSTFRGIYAIIKSIPSNNIDLYLLEDKNDTTKRDVFTYGIRINGKVSALDYTGELALQSGDNKLNTSQSSHAYAIKAGYTIPSAMNPRIGAEYDYATGDKTATASKTEAFQENYPTGHSLYGFTDDVSWTNLKAFSLSLSCNPSKDLWVGAEYWDYKKAEANNSSANLGTEYNLMLRYSLNSNLKFETAWVRRTAGSGGGKDYYGRTMANGDSSDFTYLQAFITY